MNDDGLIISFLSEIVTEKRLKRIEEIIEKRTRYLTVVLEDIYQSQNASAVLRTCECFGLQDVHIIENSNTFNTNPMVLQGSDKWLNIHRYNQSENNTGEAVNRLKSEGYRIIATSLTDDSTDLVDFNVENGKVAVVFGNEHQGVSEYLMKQADECLKITMCGFTQSLNISVSVGVVVSQLMQKLKNSGIAWQLTDTEKKRLLVKWLKSSVKNPEMLINRLIEECGNNSNGL